MKITIITGYITKNAKTSCIIPPQKRKKRLLRYVLSATDI